MSVYGKEFARIYSESLAAWTEKNAWPFVSRIVLMHIPHGRSWLDLCCGTGWLLSKVCQLGFEAVGLDNSTHQLKQARANAPKAKLVRANVQRFRLRQKFDVVTCLYDSLNYLTRKNDLLRAFRNAHRHLDSAGRFIFDMNTFEGLQDVWNRTSASDKPAWTLIMSSSFDEKRASGRVIITGFVKKGRLYKKFQEEHIERGYKAAEIEELLARAGFGFRKYDGRDFRRPRKRSPRLMYVCRKNR